MCEYCHRFPHDSRCPEAPEPPIVCYCSECKEPIHEGDTYYPIGEEKYCDDCMTSFRQTAESEVDDVWFED